MLLIRTLGGLTVSDGDRLLGGALAQPRRTAILALLARAGDRGMPRERILALLWPDMAEERARPNLAQAIYALRRDLGDDESITGTTEVRINPELVGADCLRFEAACKAGKWEEAVEWYRGPFLDGFLLAGADQFNRWVDTERSALEHRYLSALERLAVAATERGDHTEAVQLWRRLAGVDPLSGRIALRLMQALAAVGDRAGAIRHAQIHTELLQQELDTAPDPDVTDYAARLRTAPEARDDSSVIPSAAPAGRAVEGSASSASESRSLDSPSLRSGSLGMTDAQPPDRRHLHIGAAALLVVIAVTTVARRDRPDLLPTIGNTTRVSADAVLELDPRISPDGSRIAYVAGDVGTMRLYVRQLSGGPPLAVGDSSLAPFRLPQWSSDGGTLWFQAKGGIYRIASLGGTARLVVTDHPEHGRALSPALSPDGKRLAYVHDDGLVIRNLDDDSETEFTTVPYPHSPSWSPDGRRIALISDNFAFVVGGAPPALTGSNLGNLGPSALWIVDPSGSREPVELIPSSECALSPTWAPDGKRLLYLSDREGSRDVYVVDIGDDNRRSSEPRRLTAGLGAHSVTLSADGTKLAYATFAFHNNVYAVTVPSDGEVSVRSAVALTQGSQTVEGLAVSPDGQWLAFDSDRSGTQEIWRMPAAGGDAERLTETSSSNFLPTWSPDGGTIVFYEYRDGRRRLRTVASTGGRVHGVLDDGSDDRYPHFSPDGTTLLFSRRLGTLYYLFTVRRTSDSSWGAAQQLTRLGAGGARWSPDGRRFLYFTAPAQELAVAAVDAPDAGTPIVPADSLSGEPIPALAEWHPDGSRIFYKAFDRAGNSTIWSVNPDGSGRRLLVRFDDPNRPTSRPEFATDGRRLFFTVGHPAADVSVMDLQGEW
jgi:Tol biopolymer transport system component/DNA-binding SARP family transcriptional activator